MYRTQTTITIVLLIAILSSFLFQPLVANAQQVSSQGVGSVLIGGTVCVATGFIANWLVSRITTWLGNITENLITSTTSWISNLGGIFADSVPTDDQRTRTEISTKEKILDPITGCFARAIFEDLNARMIGAARTSGREGGPAFVRNWRNFLQRAQYRGENIFRSILSSTTLCNHFSPSLRTIFGATNQPSIGSYNYRTGNLDPFSFRARCTMPQGWVLQNYVNDFAGNGGWEALVRLAEPQNNFYGALILSLGEAAAQRGIEERGDSAEAVSGDGFTSRRRTSTNDSCIITSYNGTCIIHEDILTPGTILGDAVKSTIQEELGYITNVDEWQELFQTLIYRIVMPRILNLAEPSSYSQEGFPPETHPNPWDGEQIWSWPGSGTPPGPAPSFGVSGCVFLDSNRNGVLDAGEGPTGYPHTVFPYDSRGNTLGPGAITDSNGCYNFSSITPASGDSQVLIILAILPPWTSTSPAQISITNFATNHTGINFGLYLPAGQAIAHVTLYRDPNFGGGSSFTRIYTAQIFSTLAGTAVGDNQASSLFGVTIPGIPVTICTDPNFLGICEVFITNVTDDNFSDNAIGDNTASSMLMAAGAPYNAQAPPTGSTPNYITLQASNGQYVTARAGGGSLIYADSGTPETFIIHDLNGGSLITGDRVVIQTVNYYYLRAHNNGGSALDAGQTEALGTWETFIATVNGNQISIQAENGIHYMTALNGGGSFVRMTATGIGPSETFTMGSASQPPPQPLPPPPPPSSIIISGLVIDEGTGFGVGDARINLLNSTGQIISSVTSGPNGTYGLTVPQSLGSVIVEFIEPPGYIPSGATSITVSDLSSNVQIDFTVIQFTP